MKKNCAISIFGSAAALGRAIGISRAGVCNWADELAQWQVDRVIGAAIRLGKITPEQAKELVKNDERQRNERIEDNCDRPHRCRSELESGHQFGHVEKLDHLPCSR